MIDFGQNRDLQADKASEDFLDPAASAREDYQRAIKALFLVLADVVEHSFQVSPSVARQRVKTQFRNYYKALL